jgi:serine/threonine protein kinase
MESTGARPNLSDTADVTVATEINDVLPFEPGEAANGDLDVTQCVDPVEQAILLDRTRPAVKRPPSEPLSSCPRLARGDVGNAAGTPPERMPSAPVRARRLGSSSEAAPSGTLLGNYRVVRPLASGGMGLLFLGEHRFLGYQVAIKLLQPSLRGDADAEGRFFAEAVATSRIGHPGVPTVLDFGHDPSGAAYLVMEYLDGETLAQHMARATPLSLDQVLDIGAQLAAILSAAHAGAVLHRDIKPDNIFLCPDPAEPSGYRVKLLDFGVAKLLADRPANAEATRHDFLVGTAWYMAPEQTFGPTGVDARCDVYSLGCVLFQVLTGQLPFCGDFEVVVQARRYSDPPPPRQFQPGLPLALDALIHRMLARQPDARPASAAEVERELRTLVVGLRLHAMGGLDEPTGTQTRFSRLAAGLARRSRELVDRAPRWAVASSAAVLVGAFGLWLVA